MDDDIELRQARKEDADAIRSLTREAFAKWVPLIGREPFPMLADYREVLKKHRIDLLFVKGELAALIETMPNDNYLRIINLSVSPTQQGRGMGRKLLDHAERLAASMGCEEIKLYTNKLFAETLTFYDRLGYQVEREEEFMGGVTVHMNKEI